MRFFKFFSGRKQNGEFGRSMVEIIGVLAIMGVISTLSIWWFGFAMSKNASNEITAEVTRRAVLVSSLKSRDLSMDKAECESGLFAETYAVECEETEFPGYFSIIMQRVPDKVIEQLIDMHWDLPYNIYVNDKHIDVYDGLTDAKGDNTIRFIFNNDFNNGDRPGYPTQEVCETETDGYKGEWKNNLCSGSDCPTNSQCYQDADCPNCDQKCANGRCVANAADACTSKSYCKDNKVYECSYLYKRPHCNMTQDLSIADCHEKTCDDSGDKAYCRDESGENPEGAEHWDWTNENPGNCNPEGTEHWDSVNKLCVCKEDFGGEHCNLPKSE